MDGAPTLLLSRQTRRHAVLFGLQRAGLIAVGVYLVVAVGVVAGFQNVTLIAVLAVGGVALYVLLRHPRSMERDPWMVRAANTARSHLSGRHGGDGFVRCEDTPFPRPVGDILILGVSRTQDSPEQAVIRHSTTGIRGAYFTATVEIEGRGDGIHSAAAIARADNALERALNTLAEAQVPVDQLSVMTRAMPGLPAAYKEQVRALRSRDLDETMLGDNIEQRMANLDRVSDNYRMFATIGIPEEAIYRWADQRMGGTDRETICQAIYSQVGQVSALLNTAGFRVVQGLGPRRLGALIRHLYVPSRSIDDLSGLRTAQDGFPAYPRPFGEALQVPDWGRQVVWCHATGTIAPYGWPSGRVTSRWMLPVVGQMFDEAANEPSTIRTVTTSWRLLSRRQSQHKISEQLLNALTQVTRDRGRVTTGEDEDQVDAGRQVLEDLRHQAAGVLPSVRVTCSAPSRVGIAAARGLVEASMADMNVDGFRWCDGRQADAMVLSLPLGRGLPR